MSEPLLDLRAGQLLAEFGAGRATPGSGSAAALMGLLAANLVKTVIALSSRKGEYKDQVELVAADLDRLLAIEQELAEAFEDDSKLWKEVVRLRRKRDDLRSAGDHKGARRAGDQALKHQREATELPLRMASVCVEIAEMATLVFDFGYRTVRGDSVVALDASVSAAFGLLGIAYLNLKDFQASQWANRQFDEVDSLRIKVDSARADAVGRLDRLRGEAAAAIGNTLPLQ